MKYYVVSDVHSFYSEMMAALNEKGFFEDSAPHKLIICGDLFDRGDESLAMQKFVMDLIKKDEVILIRGNHEDLILELIDNADYVFGKGIEYTHHWSNGTVKTVMDLTGMNVFTDDGKDIINKLCATPYITEIIPKMLDYYETEHYVFVHGWIPCVRLKNYWKEIYLPINNWREVGDLKWKEARWVNGMLANAQGVKEENKTIVCGHWNASWGHYYLDDKNEEKNSYDEISNEPYYADKIIAIDACTAISGKVNCIVLED